MHRKGLISIWFFIGVILLIYGVLILANGIYELSSPPAVQTVMADLHPAIWWGALLTAIGLVYTIRFKPGRDK